MFKVKDIKQKIVLTVVYAAVLAIFWAFELPCIFKHFLNVVCPGCGMSRAYFSLLKLDVISAFEYHPMFWSMPILYAYFWFDGRIFPSKTLNNLLFMLIVVGFAVNWIIGLV